MKKLLKNFALVVILGLLLLSTGCGGAEDYYDLSDWTPPDDAAFRACVTSLNTPDKVKNWIDSNCTWQYSTSVKSPYEFWDEKVGDCSEAGAFSSYCGHKNHYPTYQVYITYTADKAHRLCIWYVSGSGYAYTSFSDTDMYCEKYFGTFAACVADWDDHTTYTVEDYVVNDWENNVVVDPEDEQEMRDRGLYDGE